MQTYEIRILNDDLSTRLIVKQQYIGDGAALRSARRFAELRRFEVWRGLTCVSGAARPMPAAQSLNKELRR
jgi:hypothetical protein